MNVRLRLAYISQESRVGASNSQAPFGRLRLRKHALTGGRYTSWRLDDYSGLPGPGLAAGLGSSRTLPLLEDSSYGVMPRSRVN